MFKIYFFAIVSNNTLLIIVLKVKGASRVSMDNIRFLFEKVSVALHYVQKWSMLSQNKTENGLMNANPIENGSHLPEHKLTVECVMEAMNRTSINFIPKCEPTLI